MAENYMVVNMVEAVALRQHPAITRWNRLEGRPRTHNFDRALQAEVRDALWFLARQWQMGEFRGDDAGSPVLARACIDVTTIDRFQAGQGPVEVLPVDEPLEARVERRPLPLRAGAQYLSLDLRLLVGRRWLKLLAREAAAGRLAADYRARYLAVPAYQVPEPDPANPDHALVCAHADAWQAASAAAGRALDGIALLEYLADPTHHAFDGLVPAVVPADEPQLDALAGTLRDWFNELIVQPPAEGNDAWLPGRLEYQFGLAAPDPAPGGGEVVMRAEEYYQGTLDWYTLERRPDEATLDGGRPAPPPERSVHTFLPAPIVFEGMPSTRWWAFEDRRTNFGQVRPDTTDLGKLLLMEFALVYANDWFVLPYVLPVGRLAEVKGIAISNVFNERFWVEPASARAAGAGWEQWAMFRLSAAAAERQAPPARLVLLPTAPKVQESAPVEQAALIRDEISNMVWGIERRIPLPSGRSKPGAEAGRELLGFLQQPLAEQLAQMQARRAELEAIPAGDRTPAEQAELDQLVIDLANILPPDPAAPVRYRVMNSVPEHWIPFIPVHVDGSVRETQLQRAALPRLLEGDPNPPVKVRPRTALLRQNLPKAYFIFEEEVPRAGVTASQAYQRTRWTGGKVFTWLGVRKQTGRGEGWSGLRFDTLEEMPPQAGG